MTITKEFLEAQLNNLKEKQARLQTDALLHEGAMQFVALLIGELDKPEPTPVPSKPFIVPPPEEKKDAG